MDCQLNPAKHLDRIDQRSRIPDDVFHIPARGTGVDIYILDTGLYSAQGRRRAVFHTASAGGPAGGGT